MVVTAVELEQFVIDFGREVDFNGALNMADFYDVDGHLFAGEVSVHGRPAIRQFYEHRNERVRSEQRGARRTVRHSYKNLQIELEGEDSATVRFGSINYSGAGTPPIRDFAGPTMYSDCTMKLRRDAGRQWFITELRAVPVFVGNDPFLNKTMKV